MSLNHLFGNRPSDIELLRLFSLMEVTIDTDLSVFNEENYQKEIKRLKVKYHPDKYSSEEEKRDAEENFVWIDHNAERILLAECKSGRFSGIALDVVNDVVRVLLVMDGVDDSLSVVNAFNLLGFKQEDYLSKSLSEKIVHDRCEDVIRNVHNNPFSKIKLKSKLDFLDVLILAKYVVLEYLKNPIDIDSQKLINMEYFYKVVRERLLNVDFRKYSSVIFPQCLPSWLSVAQ